MKLADIHKTLGEERKKRNISQLEIADALKVEQATVSLYENGKRGVPLDILDEWLKILEIEVKITPKGFEPVRPAEDTEDDLRKFWSLKQRRNYLIAEMRSMMAEKMMKMPEFKEKDDESGEGNFWPYSYIGSQEIGIIETRYDHPGQKFLAVEYTSDGVNVYKFLSKSEVSDEESDQEWLKVNRIYFSEDDFLTFSSLWEQESMDMRKVTLLGKNKDMPKGIELINTEGFSVHSLLEIHDNYARFLDTYNEVKNRPEYTAMDDELDIIFNSLIALSLNNRLGNGTRNTEFEFWTEQDKEAIDVPLWSEERSWEWIEEGLSWKELWLESREIEVMDEDDYHKFFHTLRQENGDRVIGLIDGDKPAVFKNNPARTEIMYRVKTDPDELTEGEMEQYKNILASKTELEKIKEITEIKSDLG